MTKIRHSIEFHDAAEAWEFYFRNMQVPAYAFTEPTRRVSPVFGERWYVGFSRVSG